MKKGQLSPLRISFLLSEEEQKFLMVVCSLFLIGLAVRYCRYKYGDASQYLPRGVDAVEYLEPQID